MFRFKILDKLIDLSKKIVLPGFDGVPLYDVGLFFYRGLSEGFITSRASAVSFNFFLAIFPSLLFFFTIIPMVPIQDFQSSLLELIREFMPTSAYETVHVTIEDIVTRPHAGWFSVGFLLSLYFSTNGIYSLMEGFNNTYHSIESRGWFKLRLVSLALILIYSVMLIVAIGLITFGVRILELVLPGGDFQPWTDTGNVRCTEMDHNPCRPVFRHLFPLLPGPGKTQGLQVHLRGVIACNTPGHHHNAWL